MNWRVWLTDVDLLFEIKQNLCSISLGLILKSTGAQWKNILLVQVSACVSCHTLYKLWWKVGRLAQRHTLLMIHVKGWHVAGKRGLFIKRHSFPQNHKRLGKISYLLTESCTAVEKKGKKCVNTGCVKVKWKEERDKAEQRLRKSIEE